MVLNTGKCLVILRSVLLFFACRDLSVNGDGFLGVNETVELSETCNLTITDPTFKKQLKQALAFGDKLIFINVTFEEERGLFPNLTGDIFEPLKMIRVRGKSGQGLLWLRDQFIVLSLTTLRYGVDQLHLSLKESPSGCFTQLPIEYFEYNLMNYIVNDFRLEKDAMSSWTDNEQICNKHIKDVNGTAHFHYYCCKIEKGKLSECSEIKKDFWASILLLCTVIFNCVVVLYIPLFVPPHLYRASYGYIGYEHILSSPMKLKLLRTKQVEDSEQRKNVVHISTLKEMPKFNEIVNNLQEDQSYEMKLNVIDVKVLRGKLIPENHVPVGILNTLYRSIFQCKIRKKVSLQKCCTSGIFCSLCGNRFQWYKCLKKLMTLILVVCIAIPWVIRILIYVLYEKVMYEDSREVVRNRNLTYSYPGSLTLLLSPFHAIFLLCYGLIILDVMFLGILKEEVTEKFKYILRKCFRDMRERSRGRAIGWAFMVLLKPFQKYGLLGCLLAPIYWIILVPVVLKVLAFYLFPTVNLTIRLLAHLAAHLTPNKKSQESDDSETNENRLVKKAMNFLDLEFLIEKETVEKSNVISMKNRCLQLIVISICLFSVYSLILLAVECVSVIVEIIVYTLIGIILNAAATMRFVTLIFMLVLYARDCFGSVTERYLAFNKVIASVALENVKEDVEKVSWQTANTQKNTAFQLPTIPQLTSTQDSNPKLIVKNGVLRWKVNRLILFFDKHDTPFITHKFFFDTLNMPCSGCPGPLLLNLVSAISKFMVIIVFLMFVSMVVFVFGEVNEISGTNQTMATLAGGFLPFVFTKILFKRNPDPTINTGNVHFKACFSNVIGEYSQSWPVDDIYENTKPEISTTAEDENSTHENPSRDSVDDNPDDSEKIHLMTTENLEYMKLEDYDLIIVDDRKFKHAEKIV